MQGQWFGEFNGGFSGSATLNVELIDKQYSGHAILIDANTNNPSFSGNIRINLIDDTEFSGIIDTIKIFDKQFFFEQDIQRPNHTLPLNIDIKGKKNIYSISGTWKSNINTQGTFNLDKFIASTTSIYKEISQVSWCEFKKEISNLDKNENYIFRGQPGVWPLRTSFHRANRWNLRRYMNEDIPILNRHFTALGLNFDLNNSFQYGGLLYLAQHYGYPTPLLDWTLSPFIGAYFAYSGLENNIENNDKVRVFCFDKKNWVSDTPQIRNLISPFPTLTYSELHPFSNNRAMPQQAISTLSHFDDIEKYIKNRADENKKNYLKIYELPSSERNEVIDELHWMGISASSMYPGIEGVCKMLREKYFR